VYVVGSIIHVVLFVFIALMWVRFIVDWVMVFARQWQPTGPLLVVLDLPSLPVDAHLALGGRVRQIVHLAVVGVEAPRVEAFDLHDVLWLQPV